LHGSVNWFRTTNGKYLKINNKPCKEKGRFLSSLNEEILPVLLYPGRKLEYIEPTLELLEILKKELRTRKTCIVIGYSFPDEHMLRLFVYSARRNRDLRLILISPDAYTIYHKKLEKITDPETTSRTRKSKSLKSDKSINSDLVGRVIILPYKIQHIISDLSTYCIRLNEGLEEEIILNDAKINTFGKYDPFNAQGGDWISCIKKFYECEYFNKICDVLENINKSFEDLLYVDYKLCFKILVKYILNITGAKIIDRLNAQYLIQKHLDLKNVLRVKHKDQSIQICFEIGYRTEISLHDMDYLFMDLMDVIKNHEIQHKRSGQEQMSISKLFELGLKYLSTFYKGSNIDSSYLDLGQNGRYYERISRYRVKKHKDFAQNELSIIRKIKSE
jgi:hypothetical protein